MGNSDSHVPSVGDSGHNSSRGNPGSDDQSETEKYNYLDFEIEINPGVGREYHLSVQSPAGEARETLTFPYDELALENSLKSLEIALLRSGGEHRLILTPDERVVQEFGNKLFDSLFTGEVRIRYDLSNEIASRQGRGLRLRLRINTPKLAKLPWEYLYDPRIGEFICLSRSTPIVRHPELTYPNNPLKVNPPLQILGMICSPRNLPLLNVDLEKQRLEIALDHLQRKGLVKLHWINGETWRDLQHAMRQRSWHIFHFIGHGGFNPAIDQGMLALTGDDGKHELISATDLSRLLTNHHSLRLVILNACASAQGSENDVFSSTASILIRKGLQAVLAMQYAITDRAAIEFSRSFYEAIADGLPVDAAVSEARVAICLAVANTFEWGTPVLFMRAPQGVLFDTKAEVQPRNTYTEKISLGEAVDDKLREVTKLLTEGLTALNEQDWDTAILKFKAVLELSPNDPEAKSKMEEAQTQKRLAISYSTAKIAIGEDNWEKAYSFLSKLTAEVPTYKDAKVLFQLTRQRLCAIYYNEARIKFKNGDYQEVVLVFEKIKAIDSLFPDKEKLLSSSQEEIDRQEKKRAVGNLYQQGLTALENENWEEANRYFKSVLELKPDHKEAAQKISESLRLQKFCSQYLEARTAIDTQNWEKAIAVLMNLIQEAPDFKDSKALLQQTRQSQCTSLYDEARRNAKDRNWQDVIQLLDKIASVDPKYPDQDNLRTKTNYQLDQQKRLSNAESLYQQALGLMENKKWQDALRTFQKVEAVVPDYREVKILSEQVRKELASNERNLPRKGKRISRREFLKISGYVIGSSIVLGIGGKLLNDYIDNNETPTPTIKPSNTSTPKQNFIAEPTEKHVEATQEVVQPTTVLVDSWPTNLPLDMPRNRTLIYYYGLPPMAGACNPFGSSYDHRNGNAILYEPAAFYNALGDKTILWLAESAQSNADATEWTITFRKGIKWSDGTAFTAADAAWSMETLKAVDGLNRASTYKNELVKAEAVDDVTLKVSLNQSDYRFFFKSLTFRFDLGDDTAIQPKHFWETLPAAEIATAKIFDAAKGTPVSTGPYAVTEANEQYTNYDIRKSWWAYDTGLVKDVPVPWRIKYQEFRNEETAAQLLINKEIDLPHDFSPFVLTSTLAQGDHLTTWTGRKVPYGYMDWWPISVQFCTKKKPFNNPKVRWAVAYALNQQSVVDTGWGGAGKVAYGPFPEYPALNKYMDGIKDITDQYNVLEFNLEKSAVLMSEAGFTKNADGWWADTEGNVVDGDLYAGVPMFGDIAPIVVEQLRNAGFKSEHMAPPDVWAAKVDGRASMFLFGHSGGTKDPWDTFNLYVGANAAPMGEQSWGNVTRWSNPEFEAVTLEMNNTAMNDTAKMNDLFRQGMQIWYENLPDCPLVQWYHRIPVNNWYFTNWPDENNPYMNSAFWHLTMLQVVLGLKATGN